MTKSMKTVGVVRRVEFGCHGVMPWESPYAIVDCDDGTSRHWWFAEERIPLVSEGVRVCGFVRASTNCLFRVWILDRWEGGKNHEGIYGTEKIL